MDANTASKKASKPSARLTRAQAARVRSLIEDEGETRASAVAWVLAFEPAPAPVPFTEALDRLVTATARSVST